MKTDLFKMNLQLFNDDVMPETKEVETDEIEIDDTLEEEGIELEVDEEEVEQQEETQEEVKQPEKTVPFKALEAERKKYQDRLNDPKLKKAMALADKLSSATGKDYDAIMAELEQLEIQKHVNAGISPEVAQTLVQTQRRMQELEQSINKSKYDNEISTLKANPYYSDIDEVREEVETLSARTGLSIKQAYNALYADTKSVDMERSIEQRVLNNIAKKQGKKLDTTSNGTVKVQSSVKLTPEQRAIAKMSGMTDLEYYNMLHISDVEQYQKLKKK